MVVCVFEGKVYDGGSGRWRVKEEEGERLVRRAGGDEEDDERCGRGWVVARLKYLGHMLPHRRGGLEEEEVRVVRASDRFVVVTTHL